MLTFHLQTYLSCPPEGQQPSVTHRSFHEEEVECEPTMVALHGLAGSINQGADRESREADMHLYQNHESRTGAGQGE